MVKAYSPRLASFSLAHLATLSDEPALVLSVSERTFYVLLNLMTADILDEKRWAVEYLPSGYVPVKPGDPEYQTMLDAVEGLEREVYDVTSQLFDLLSSIDKRVAPVNVYHGENTHTAVAGGAYQQSFGPVQAGEYWHLSNITSRVVTGTYTHLYHSVVWQGVIQHRLRGNITGITSELYAVTQPDIWLKPGDTVAIEWFGLSAGAQVQARVAVAVYQEWAG